MRCLSSALAGPSSHLTRALTVDRTTLDSRNSGVTRMWKREREAKATEGEKSASLKKLAWPTKVCGQRRRVRAPPTPEGSKSPGQGTQGDLPVRDTSTILTAISWQRPGKLRTPGWKSGTPLPILPRPCQGWPGGSPQVGSALPRLRQQSSVRKTITTQSQCLPPGYLAGSLLPRIP